MTPIQNLLPVGSVVRLKKSEKRVMIVGILLQSDGVKYDYISVMYPEGFMDQNHMYLMNHEDIDKVEFIGFMDSEYQIFRSAVAKNIQQ